MAHDLQSTSDAPQEDAVIEGHNYDGIREYDNPMPGWWVGIFVASVIFAPIYILGVHTFGFINTYEDDLSASQAELQTVRDAYEAENPSFVPDSTSLASFVDDPIHIAAGAEAFATNCAACHGMQGQGLIGPNLTDAYWVHGPSTSEMFSVITDGVLEKGMTPWGNILSPEQRAQLVAYVVSIQGTTPDGAKGPEGELYDI